MPGSSTRWSRVDHPAQPSRARNNTTVESAVADGELELNVMTPVTRSSCSAASTRSTARSFRFPDPLVSGLRSTRRRSTETALRSHRCGDALAARAAMPPARAVSRHTHRSPTATVTRMMSLTTPVRDRRPSRRAARGRRRRRSRTHSRRPDRRFARWASPETMSCQPRRSNRHPISESRSVTSQSSRLPLQTNSFGPT